MHEHYVQNDKQRTTVLLPTIHELLNDGISSQEDDPAFADVWHIENISGIAEEKVRGE